MVGPRSVFDTNVLISALLNSISTPGLALNCAENIGLVLYSEAMLLELRSVLGRAKFAPYVSADTIEQLFDRIRSSWVPVPIISQVQACSDPDDDKFLDIALNGAATHLISGDRALLAIHTFKSTRILSPAQFLVEVVG